MRRVFDNTILEKLDARDRQIGPSGQVLMVPAGLKVDFRMAENRERSGTIRHSIRIDFRRMRFCKYGQEWEGTQGDSIRLRKPTVRGSGTTRDQVSACVSDKGIFGRRTLAARAGGQTQPRPSSLKVSFWAPKPMGDVTLRELATHTSGLPDIIANPNKPLSQIELGRSADEALRDATTRPIAAPPGSRFQYDQTNYLLIMRVIEHVSGQSFREFLTAHVLQPAMPQTTWGDARSVVMGRSDMYTALKGDGIQNGGNLFEYPTYLDAAAGLNSNIIDMERFACLLTSGKMLSASELDRMWQPARGRSGRVVDIAKDMELPGVAAPAAGWFYADNSSGKYPRVFMAGGSATSILVFPKQGLCIVVLTNLQAKDDPLPIAEGIAKFYLPNLEPLF